MARVPHARDRVELEPEEVGLARVAQRAAVADHRVGLLGLEALAAAQAAELVRAEVDRAVGDRPRREGGGERASGRPPCASTNSLAAALLEQRARMRRRRAPRAPSARRAAAPRRRRRRPAACSTCEGSDEVDQQLRAACTGGAADAPCGRGGGRGRSRGRRGAPSSTHARGARRPSRPRRRAACVVASPVPTTHGMPSSRETIAAWQVMPPESVTIAAARRMSGTQSGEVMCVTSTSPSRSRVGVRERAEDAHRPARDARRGAEAAQRAPRRLGRRPARSRRAPRGRPS